jgi:hypothetical protein
MGALGQSEREQLLGRIEGLRTVLPAFAQELVGARRQSAALRVENARLLEEVRRLQRLAVPPATRPARRLGRSARDLARRR